MTRMTVEMLRKRAEHNEGVLENLQEIALHQFEIERIEPVLGEACRHLRILLLQNNLISRIENLSKLAELQYLNLALNNIRRIEGLEHCESLQKLDLTANFIDDLASVQSLAANTNLRELFLVGNPIAASTTNSPHHYREFVIAVLPQLVELDGQAITKTERITANQNKQQSLNNSSSLLVTQQPSQSSDSSYTPEKRTELFRKVAERRDETKLKEEQHKQQKRQEREQAINQVKWRDDGSGVMQTNEAEVEWKMTEVDDGCCGGNGNGGNGFVELDVGVPRFLDTSQLVVEPQPLFVKVVIKGKLLVLNWPVEVQSSKGVAERSTITGHLLLRFPKALPSSSSSSTTSSSSSSTTSNNRITSIKPPKQQQQRNQTNGDQLNGTVNPNAIVNNNNNNDDHDEPPPLE